MQKKEAKTKNQAYLIKREKKSVSEKDAGAAKNTETGRKSEEMD